MLTDAWKVLEPRKGLEEYKNSGLELLFAETRCFAGQDFFLLLIDPPSKKTQGILGSDPRPRKLVPVGQPEIVDVPMGYHVMTPE